ncbi:hypothetical protein [Caballeronia sp. DA-9]
MKTKWIGSLKDASHAYLEIVVCFVERKFLCVPVHQAAMGLIFF